MALVTLDQAKEYLDVIHDFDDSKIQLALDAAHDEAVLFLNYDNLVDFEAFLASAENPYDNPPASAQMAILVLTDANYQANDEAAKALRKISEVKLMPFRICLGI